MHMLLLPLVTLVCARCSISLRYFALLFPLQILLELRSERSWWIWLLLSSNFGVTESSSQFFAFSCSFCSVTPSDHLKSSVTVKMNETAARVWVGWCSTLQSTSGDISPSCLETSTHEDGRPTANTHDCNLVTLHTLLVVKMERGNETVVLSCNGGRGMWTFTVSLLTGNNFRFVAYFFLSWFLRELNRNFLPPILLVEGYNNYTKCTPMPYEVVT